MDVQQASQLFWNWFTTNERSLRELSNPSEPFWDVALEQLQLVDERLWFELSNRDDEIREFIVTAQGNIEAFDAAQALITAAPVTLGWRLVPLKPAMGFDFKTNYENKIFDPREMWFLPLVRAGHPQFLGLRVGIEGLKPERNADSLNAVLVILDTALDERVAALEIEHVEVSPLPPDPESLGYIELPELSDYISWRKRKIEFGN